VLARIVTLSLFGLGGCHLVFPHTPRPGWSESGTGDGGLDAGVRDGSVDLGSSRLRAITVGSAHACALLWDGSVRCWGWNDWGMLGDGSRVAASTPVTVKDLPGARAIAAGAVHTCAIALDHVYCWGYGGWQQIGNPASEVTRPFQLPNLDAAGKPLSRPEQLAIGHQHTCRLGVDGRVHCAGQNDHGQLGDGSTTESLAPVEVSGLAGCTVTAIASGLHHLCALCDSGQVRCWGRNDLGQLGDGGSQDATSATAVTLADKSTLQDAVELFAGSQAACARRAAGTLVCWGENRDLQLTGAPGVRRRAEPLATSQPFDELALGAQHGCGREGGRVFCWGDNVFGSLGDGEPPTPRSLPREVAGLVGVRRIASGGATSCALLHDEVRCWGANGRGQVGGGNDGVLLPTPVSVAGARLLATEIDAGERHTCAVSKDGRVYCWGRGTSGELGSSVALAPAPIEVLHGGKSFAGATRITAGHAHSCAIEGETVYCWGWNADGQLGLGVTGASTVTAVPGLAALEVSAGARHTCFQDKASLLAYCSGSNKDGRLGLGTTITETATPKPITTLGPVGSLAVGDEASCARSGASLRCWGANWSGLLGVGDINARSTPTLVLGLGSVKDALALGRSHACVQHDQSGIKVSCWGRGGEGQLGDGTTTSRLRAEAPVTGLAAVKDLDASPGMDWTGAHTCAVTAADTVVCWGWNAWGQLGLTDRLAFARTPQAVTGLTKGKRVTTGTHHSCAITDADEVWCWGYNGDGQVGSGSLPIVARPATVAGL
jgi:alpha-tubulin suppressor-like RCC1 family protein